MSLPRGLAAAALLTSVLAFAAVGCGGGGGGGGEAASTGTTAAQTGTTGGASGNADQGRQVFEDQGCGSCHTLKEANASGTVGPNLDEQLPKDAQTAGKPLADFTKESIENPDAYVAQGFSKGVMPSDFGDKLSDEQLNNLVAFVVKSASQ